MRAAIGVTPLLAPVLLSASPRAQLTASMDAAAAKPSSVPVNLPLSAEALQATSRLDAWGPSMLPVALSACAFCGYDEVIQGIKWAIDHGPGK